ncbi:hypothetical protein AAMO2058_001604200 [Amorphochlora amoebiformis]
METSLKVQVCMCPSIYDFSCMCMSHFFPKLSFKSVVFRVCESNKYVFLFICTYKLDVAKKEEESERDRIDKLQKERDRKERDQKERDRKGKGQKERDREENGQKERDQKQKGRKKREKAKSEEKGREETKVLIESLDAKATALQAKGDDRRAVRLWEKSLILKRNTYGVTSNEVNTARERLTKEYNRASVRLIALQNTSEAESLLRRAQILAEPFPSSLALTLNNFGCLYKSMGKIRIALRYMLEALDIEQENCYITNTSGTHINICAVYSELKKYKLAEQHARLAVRLLEQEFFGVVLSPAEDPTIMEMMNDVEIERIDLYAAAVFNRAVQLEYLQKWDQSLRAYMKSLRVIKKFPVDEALKSALTEACREAEGKLRNKVFKQRSLLAKVKKKT